MQSVLVALALVILFAREMYAFQVSARGLSSSSAQQARRAISVATNPASSCSARFDKALVICGPSGAGKGSIIAKLLSAYDGSVALSVSHTSRAPRPAEIDGFHYHFKTKEWMASVISNPSQRFFIESAEVHGNYYGTSFEAVRSVQDSGKVCILDIDVNGVKTIKKTNLLPAWYVFVVPPSIDALRNRLRGRGTETEEQLAVRLSNAEREMQYGAEASNFDVKIVNDNLDEAVRELSEFIESKFPIKKTGHKYS